MTLDMPASLLREHEALPTELRRATRAGGEAGRSVRRLRAQRAGQRSAA